MKKIIALVVGTMLSFGLFYYYFDLTMMEMEMPERREDVFGFVKSVDSNEITLIPFDMSLHPYQNLSLSEAFYEFYRMTDEDKFQVQEIMKDKVQSEITVRIPPEKNIYEQFRSDSEWVRVIPIGLVPERSLIIIWWENSDWDLKKIEHIMVYSPRIFQFTPDQLEQIYKKSTLK